MEDAYINLGSHFKLNRSKKELISLKTGEIYNKREEVIPIIEQLKKDKQFNQSMERGLRETFELPTGIDLYQYKWKKDCWFIKMYRTEKREYMKQIKLSNDAGLLLVYIENYIEYGTNRIAKEDKSDFTNKELQAISNLGRDKIKKCLNELEDTHFIKRVGNKQARKIYFNPYLVSAGNEVEKNTIKMFDDYKPITPY